MGCGQSNARIAVEPLNVGVNKADGRPPASPVRTSPAGKKQVVTNGGMQRPPFQETTTTQQQQQQQQSGSSGSQPATTNAVPWANNNQNDIKKKKKKNNKIVVTNRATKSKPTPSSSIASKSKSLKENVTEPATTFDTEPVVTSTFYSEPAAGPELTTTETYGGSNNETNDGAGLTPVPSASSRKLKPVKVSRKKRQRNEIAGTNSNNNNNNNNNLNNIDNIVETTDTISGNGENEGSSLSTSAAAAAAATAESSLTSATTTMLLPELSTPSPLSFDQPSLDSPEPTPPPPPPEPLVDPARQKDPRPCPALEKVGPATLGVQTSMNDSRFSSEGGIQGLSQRWGEVEFLLRIPILNNNDIDVFHRTAYQSILLLHEIERMARELNVLQGALSRWLMPFDANTSVADQSHVRSVVNPNDSNGNIPPENPAFSSVSTDKRREMTHQLMDLRKLVRVKIADDGDLAQALQAVADMDAFFRLLVDEASIAGDVHGVMLPYDLLQAHLTF